MVVNNYKKDFTLKPSSLSSCTNIAIVIASTPHSTSSTTVVAPMQSDKVNNEPVTAVPDTEATRHFIPSTCPGKPVPHAPIQACCANTTIMSSMGTKEPSLPILHPSQHTATVFQDIKKTLLSAPVLCDGDLTITFTKSTVMVKGDNINVIMRGKQDPKTSLWLIPIEENTRAYNQYTTMESDHQVHNAYHQQTIPSLVSFLHAACGAPLVTT